MTTIKLNSANYGGSRIELKMRINYRDRIFGSIDAFFDTGCPKPLIISEGEAMRLKIPFGSLEQGQIVILGGQRYQSGILRNVKITLRDEQDVPLELAIPEAYVLKSTSRTQRSLGEAHQFPNLIGLDFTYLFNFSVRSNPTTKEWFFEKQ